MRNKIKIKGFIGFFGEKIKENLLDEALCNTLKKSIKDGIILYKPEYTVIVSKDYLSLNKDGSLSIKTSDCALKYDEKMMVYIKINNKSLHIERDRWGTSNLYYKQTKRGVYFSSDIRFILALPIKNITLYDVKALEESASLGYIYEAEKTLFCNINQLPRNTVLDYDLGCISLHTNRISADKNRFVSFDEAYSSLKNCFEDMVISSTNILGKKAYLLSGGMDSSAISIAASKSTNIETVVFSSDSNSNDVFFANQLAKQIGSKHIVIKFQDSQALINLPSFINDIENVEFEGIFSPLGGYAYYLLCKEIKELDFDWVIPGEGADELLGGYYWQLTHPFGFVDKLKQLTQNTNVYSKVINIFPEIEEKNIYREIVYYFLQGTALTNYHLNCIEHTSKAFGMGNFPVFMSTNISNIIKDIPMKWLCDGNETKIVLRKYLLDYLKAFNLSKLVTRKKMAMPSVITQAFHNTLNNIAEKASKLSDCPYKGLLKNKSLNIFMLDLFHKYYTLRPLDKVDEEEWLNDLSRIEKNESFVHW